MNVFRSYADYLKKIDELIEKGLVNKSFKKKTFSEWHLDDYADRVQDYLVEEFMEDNFVDQCYRSGNGSIDRQDAEGDELFDFIWQIIEYNYFKKNNVPQTAGMIRENLRVINMLKDYLT